MYEISSLCTYAFKGPGKFETEELDTLVHINIFDFYRGKRDTYPPCFNAEQEEKIPLIL